ncbi:DUF493 family protein [Capnocytophaga sp. oral taxon 338]|uniref:DUF493 family protein n=1 Tax=Capnocytophaga sp. oral taxon 338 TaxID=710239 RepID=UPI000202F4AA|nr:DUF493 family protein [Capnocytophaga sp. oral taxon 338]EGD34747.1 hypothetical protein HMPREF9071_0669 [Capnocytophaga sp. oral taxon 338 str. F0234]
MQENITSHDFDAFYAKLKSELEQTTVFPSEYLYKFILPATQDKREQIQAVFKNTAAITEEKPSSNGKYISYSIRLMMDSPDQVIHYYKEAGKIEGIISL